MDLFYIAIGNPRILCPNCRSKKRFIVKREKFDLNRNYFAGAKFMGRGKSKLMSFDVTRKMGKLIEQWH